MIYGTWYFMFVLTLTLFISDSNYFDLFQDYVSHYHRVSIILFPIVIIMASSSY